MFRFDEGLKVYLHRDPVDFRMGINGLSILVAQAMRLNPMTSALFLVGNRDRDRIKILGRAATASGCCSSDSKPIASSGRTKATRSRSALSSCIGCSTVSTWP
nr:IS66 family insertion sequence element accessory protein TnpB [Burkholderia vietnamiensis]